MAELLIRAGAQDAALMARLLAHSPQADRPSRLVVDAHVAASSPELSVAARGAGLPFLVDPQTHFFQDVQHADSAWAVLPYASPLAHTPGDILRPSRLDEIVAGVIEYQVAAGATAVVVPYVHVEGRDDGWVEVQLALWRATRRYMERQGVSLPLVAVVALGWRLLDRVAWADGLAPLRRGIKDLHAAEVALAASKVDTGAFPEARLASLIAAVRRLRQDSPVIAWQQGTLGEAAVAAGAIGYECGIGWRERCDLRTSMATQRKPSSGGSARPVYVESLGRGIPKKSLRLLLDSPRIGPELVCLDAHCCPRGRASLLDDARGHAIRARLRGLEAVTQPAQPAWRWNVLAGRAATGLELMDRINAMSERQAGVTRVDDAAMRAVSVVAEHRRQTLGRHRAA